MTDLEFTALIAIVQRQNVMLQSDVQKYGEVQFDPRTSEVIALENEWERRQSGTAPLDQKSWEAGRDAAVKVACYACSEGWQFAANSNIWHERPIVSGKSTVKCGSAGIRALKFPSGVPAPQPEEKK